MKTGPTTGSVTEEAITSQIPTLETSTSGKQEHTNMQKLNVRGTVVRSDVCNPLTLFLGPRGPLGLEHLRPFVRSPARKI